MMSSDERTGRPGLSRRRFGRRLAAGLGAVAALPGLKRIFNARRLTSLREAEFYERLGHDQKKQETGVER